MDQLVLTYTRGLHFTHSINNLLT